MNEERNKLFFHWSEAQQKFDYYMTGLIAAVVVYLIKGIHPTTIGFNPSTVELVAIAALGIALLAGLTHIERGVTMLRVSYDLAPKEEWLATLRTRHPGQRIARQSTPTVDMTESEIEANVAAVASAVSRGKKGLDRHKSVSRFLYNVRNIGFLLGIALLLAGRILGAYFV